MKPISDLLAKTINNSVIEFKKFSNDDWNYRYGPRKWSRREILGHLIDSAANNHQRFVRIQFEEIPNIVYAQDDWVSVQKYDSASAESLIELWAVYNKHLIHLFESIPDESMGRLCDINKEEPVTLKWLISDYVERHMEHHLDQIFNW